MEVTTQHAIAGTAVTLTNTTQYPNPPYRGDFSSLMYVTKTTDNTPILTPPYNPHDFLQDEWFFDNADNGHYKSELLMVPNFDSINYWVQSTGGMIEQNTVVHYYSVFYRAKALLSHQDPGSGMYPNPDVDLAHWAIIDTTDIDNVYNAAQNAALTTSQLKSYYGTHEFDVYNELGEPLSVVINSVPLESAVILQDATVYGDPGTSTSTRNDVCSLMYVKNNNPPYTPELIPTAPTNHQINNWTVYNLADGEYRAELLLVPRFSHLVNISEAIYTVIVGTVVQSDSDNLFYRVKEAIHYSDIGDGIPPHMDTDHWELISDISNITNVYNYSFHADPDLPYQAKIYYGTHFFLFYNDIDPNKKITVEMSHTPNETSIMLINLTDYPDQITRQYYASMMYVKNIDTNTKLTVTQGDPLLNDNYVFNNIADGEYKAELLMIPEYNMFQTNAEGY